MDGREIEIAKLKRDCRDFTERDLQMKMLEFLLLISKGIDELIQYTRCGNHKDDNHPYKK
jgi:hypothetical protein